MIRRSGHDGGNSTNTVTEPIGINWDAKDWPGELFWVSIFDPLLLFGESRPPMVERDGTSLVMLHSIGLSNGGDSIMTRAISQE